jgi:hypothetical protein
MVELSPGEPGGDLPPAAGPDLATTASVDDLACGQGDGAIQPRDFQVMTPGQDS